MSLRRDARRAGIALASSLALLALQSAAGHAGSESAGTRAASFLAASPTPAVQAMGGAGLALDSGLQGSHWNTATLASLGGFAASFAHADLDAGTSQNWLAAGGRATGAWRWGVTAVHRDEGAFERRDANNAYAGTDVAQSLALSVQLARPLGSWLSVGGAARYVGEHLGQIHGNGLAFDAGLTARAGLLSVALAGQNFGGGMDWEGQRWRMPASFGAGVALRDPSTGLALALDLAAPANYHRSLRTGVEWRVRDAVALRAGYRSELGALEGERLGGMSFGVGTGRGGLWVDYSYSSGFDDAAQHRVALSLLPRGVARARVAVPSATPFGPAPQP